jgi:hypothetical protein
MTRIYLLAGLPVLLITIGSTRVLAEEIPRPVRAIPGGVVDAEERRGFVRAPASGIDALDLRTGQRLWHSGAADEPLLAAGGRLIALAAVDGEEATSEVRVVVLGTDDGTPALTSERVTLPDALPPGAASHPYHPFRAEIAGDVLTLSWEAKGRYTGGAAAPPGVRKDFASRIQGHARIDLKTGRVADAVGSVPAADPASGPGLAARVKAMKPAPFWSGPIDDGRFAALVLDAGEGGGQSLVLTSWDRGAGNEAGRRKVLVRGKTILPIVTRDGRHVLVQTDPPSDPAAIQKAPWVIIALAMGATLGEAPLLASDDQDPTIRDGLLFTIAATPGAASQPTAHVLRAKDLKTGKLLWTHPVRWPAAQPPRPDGARPR